MVVPTDQEARMVELAASSSCWMSAPIQMLALAAFIASQN